MGVVSIDVGTSIIKAVGYDDQGREQVVSRRSVPVERPRPAWAEQDMAAVWDAVANAIREVLPKVDPSVDLVAVTAQGDGAWLVDAAGRPTGPAILWNDGRAAQNVIDWDRNGVVAEAFALTGSRISTGMPNAILSWLAEHDRNRVERSHRLLTCGGWVHLCLTGEAVMDLSDASAPYLDVRSRTWADRTFELFDQPWVRDLMPDLRANAGRVASLTATAAAATGLTIGTPVVLAPYDIAATAIGAGVVAVGDASCILGTTLCTELVVDSPPSVDAAAVGITVALDSADRWLRAFPTMAGGDVLAWGARLLGLQTSADLLTLADRADAGAGGLTFLPYLSPAGERSPFFDPSAHGGFAGLSLTADRAQVARAMAEGLTLSIRECLSGTPTRPESLVLCGGGATNDVWAQLVADATGLVVQRPTDREVGARGAALVALVATGARPDLEAAVRDLVVMDREFIPDPKRVGHYDKQSERFARVRDIMSDTWAIASNVEETSP